MKYFVYFDAYGQAQKWLDEKELARQFGNNPDLFRQVAAQGERAGEMKTASGTVGVLNFGSAMELQEYLLIPSPIIFDGFAK